MNHRQSFLKGALILSAAGAISKILGGHIPDSPGQTYRCGGYWPVSDGLPDIYHYPGPGHRQRCQWPYPFSSPAKETQGFPGESRRILRVSLLLLAVFGLLLTLLVMASAKFLALHVLQDGRAYYAIVAVAPAIFLAGLMSVFRGYFQGQQTMLPTAVSLVVEQIFRVTAVLFLAYLLFPRGLEFAAAGPPSARL